jgi:hypothetical protein
MTRPQMPPRENCPRCSASVYVREPAPTGSSWTWSWVCRKCRKQLERDGLDAQQELRERETAVRRDQVEQAPEMVELAMHLDEAIEAIAERIYGPNRQLWNMSAIYSDVFVLMMRSYSPNQRIVRGDGP